MKAGAKAVKNSAVRGVKNTAKSFKELGGVAKEGGQALVKNGKMVFQGIKRGAISGAKTLDDVAQGLAKKFRFKKFKIRVKGRKWQLLGEFNPYVVVMEGSRQGEVVKVKKDQVGNTSVGGTIKIDGQEAVYFSKHRPSSSSVKKIQELIKQDFDADSIGFLLNQKKGLEIAQKLAGKRHFDADSIKKLIEQANKHGLEDQIHGLLKSGKLQNPDKLKRMLEELDDINPKLGNRHELNIASEITKKNRRVEFDTQGDVVDLDRKAVFQAKRVNSEDPRSVIENIQGADKQLAHKGTSGRRKAPGDEEPLPGFTRAANIEVANSKNPLYNASKKDVKKFLDDMVKNPAFSWDMSHLNNAVKATQKIIIKNKKGVFEFSVHPTSGLIL